MSDGLPGVSMPEIQCCPECGSHMFYAVMNQKEGVSLSLDGSGGVAHISPDHPLETTVTTLGCENCDEVIIEDGDIVNEVIADE
jgi:hypothetical protein